MTVVECDADWCKHNDENGLCTLDFLSMKERGIDVYVICESCKERENLQEWLDKKRARS